jgi:hypothetical protein
MNVKKKVTQAIYFIAPLLFLFIMIGHEFSWRFENSLVLKRSIKIRDSRMKEHLLMVEETSDSQVDTVRRDMKDIHSTTNIVISLDGRWDRLRDSIAGKYFSDFRPIHISSDSSTQIMLIPNSSQGLPTGWSQIIYLKNDSTIALKEFSGYFIGDVDKDGNEEVNIPDKGWMKLDVSSGDWIPAKLKTSPSTP